MLYKKTMLSGLFIVGISCSLKPIDEPIHDRIHERIEARHAPLLTQWRNSCSMWLTGKPTEAFTDRVIDKINALNCIKQLLDDDYSPHLQYRSQKEITNLQKDLNKQFIDTRSDLALLPNNLRKELITKHVDSDSLRERLHSKEETNKELSAQEIKKSNCKPHNNYPQLLPFIKELEKKQEEYEISNNNMWTAINIARITAACGIVFGICRYAYKKYGEYKKRQEELKQPTLKNNGNIDH